MTPEERQHRAMLAARARWERQATPVPARKPRRPPSRSYDEAYHTVMADTGCALRPHCLTCDLAECVYVDPAVALPEVRTEARICSYPGCGDEFWMAVVPGPPRKYCPEHGGALARSRAYKARRKGFFSPCKEQP